jgi:hypothetical protein
MTPKGTIVIDTAEPDPVFVKAWLDQALVVAHGEGPLAEESFYQCVLKSIGPLTLAALCAGWLQANGHRLPGIDQRGRLVNTK